MPNRRLSVEIPVWRIGTMYWKFTKRHKYLSEILRNMPNDKALGPDKLSDRWLKQNKNALPAHTYINDWINLEEKPPPWINDANLMLLSKDGTPTPEVDKTRPIAMSNALRKMEEAAWLRLYGPYLWSTINKS